MTENQIGYKTLIIRRKKSTIHRKGEREKKKTYASDIVENFMSVK